MSNSAAWGPGLYTYVQAHWRAEGTSHDAWAYAHGLTGPTVSRWKDGTEPSLRVILTVADALDVSPLGVLVATGVIDEPEGGGERGGRTGGRRS